MLTFLKKKLRDYSFRDLAYTQLEPILFWPINSIPSLPGYFFRFLACKIAFGSLRGFVWIQPHVQFVNSCRIKCGSNIAVNSGAYINAVGGIDIGNNVLIGSNVTISSGMHPIDHITGDIFENPSIPKLISIEDGVWIGAGAVIMPGITLARGCVIGANAVVTKSTQPWSVYAGVPAKFLRLRKMDETKVSTDSIRKFN